MGMAKVIGSVLCSKYSYASKCKGWDEIRPLSGAGHNFWGGLGMMVVESLDTLYIMNLQDEYKEARDWIVSSLNLDINHFTSVFETTIRLLGGLLSAVTLTLDPVFKDLSVDLAARLLRSHTDGLHFVLALCSPHSQANVNLQTGATRMEDSRVYLSEVGTNFLELSYLSAISGDLSFVQAAERIMAVLRRTPRLQGLLPLQVKAGRLGVTRSIRATARRPGERTEWAIAATATTSIC